MEPRPLTLWDQFINHEGEIFTALAGAYPVVIGIRMRVGSQHGNISAFFYDELK